MRYINYDLIPYEEKRSTGEQVVRNAFYMPDSNAQESKELYRGYSANDMSGLVIERIVPMSKAAVKALTW